MLPVTAHSASVLLISAATRMPTEKREYGQLVREVEHGVFTPLVLTSTGGMGREATIFYKRLADLLCSHWDHSYSSTIHWLRCHLFFALLRSSIMCIRGSRSFVHKPVKGPPDLSVVLVKSRLSDYYIHISNNLATN